MCGFRYNIIYIIVINYNTCISIYIYTTSYIYGYIIEFNNVNRKAKKNKYF